MTRLPLNLPALADLADRTAHEFSPASHGASAVMERMAFLRLLSDLTRRESQVAWLCWLAERVGVPVPGVGASEWRVEVAGAVAVVLFGPDDDCAVFVFGQPPPDAMAELRAMGPPEMLIECPALPNPDSADAPIRALVLAIVTVAKEAR